MLGSSFLHSYSTNYYQMDCRKVSYEPLALYSCIVLMMIVD